MSMCWYARGSRPRQAKYTLWLSVIWRVVIGSRDKEGSWLPARMLEIPFKISAKQTLIESTVRFDGFLVDASGVATLIQEATTKNIRNSSLPSQGGSDRFRADWGAANDDRALFVAVREALGDAAGSALDKMEEEIVTYAAKAAAGDWLEAADATCVMLVTQRRREILGVLQHGRVGRQGVACSTPGASACKPSALAMVASRAGAGAGWLADSATSLAACRAFFDMSEMEYAKAACLRAVRLGNLGRDAAEADMRLAAIAERYGRASAAVHLYFRMMASPEANDDERLTFSILGLTMVPPTLIGSRAAMTEFRAYWARDLRNLRKNIMSRATRGEVRDPVRAVGRTPFHLAHQGGPDLEMMASLAGLYDAAAPSLRYVAPHCRKVGDGLGNEGGPGTERDVAERSIRVGFFSVHLRDHSIGRMMAHLIVLLAENPRLEVHVFGPGGGGSGAGRHTREEAAEMSGTDLIEEALRSGVHHWHQAPLGDLHLARMVVAHEELDVLVYPDIGMDSLTYFMSFARLAPVQCVWWGHPVTPSTGAIDYFLSLDVELDGGQVDYLEQMVRMDTINLGFFKQMDTWTGITGKPHEQPLDHSRQDGNDSGREDIDETRQSPQLCQEENLKHLPVPSTTERSSAPNASVTAGMTPRDRNTVETPDALDPAGGGLPTGSPCLRNYLVLARLFKLHPDFDAAVEGILVADADGCVVLIHETTDEEWTRAVWSRLRGALVQRGVYDRLRIMHHWLYPQALRGATAVLDTFPYGGCLTVLEGLSSGVPVVTLPADFIRGRFALAMYQQMGYTDLVVDNVEEYVSLAVRLGTVQAFREETVARVQEAYRESLHKNQQSAHEWATFFVRASELERK